MARMALASLTRACFAAGRPVLMMLVSTGLPPLDRLLLLLLLEPLLLLAADPWPLPPPSSPGSGAKRTVLTGLLAPPSSLLSPAPLLSEADTTSVLTFNSTLEKAAWHKATPR